MRQTCTDRNECILLACDVGIIWPSAHMSRLRPEVDPTCRWCGEGQEAISHIFQECPQLAVERADAGVSNPRDLWDAPAVALRFAGAIGFILGLY